VAGSSENLSISAPEALTFTVQHQILINRELQQQFRWSLCKILWETKYHNQYINHKFSHFHQNLNQNSQIMTLLVLYQMLEDNKSLDKLQISL